MIDWAVYLRLTPAPVLIAWVLCGGCRLLDPAPVLLDALVWDAYLAKLRPRALPPPVTLRGRHRAVVQVYRPAVRPARHSREYFAARDTDTAELPVIRSDP